MAGCIACSKKNPPHYCPTYTGGDLPNSDLCISCIDGVECPEDKKHRRNHPSATQTPAPALTPAAKHVYNGEQTGGYSQTSEKRPATSSAGTVGRGNARQHGPVSQPADSTPRHDEDVVDDAVSALQNQGYTPRQARNAVDAAVLEVGTDDLSRVIRAALAKGPKAEPQQKAQSAPEEGKNVERKHDRYCQHQGCTRFLRKDSKGNFCGKHQPEKHPTAKPTTAKSKPRPAAAAPPAPAPKPRRPDVAEMFSLQVGVAHLDAYLLQLPTDRKLAIVQNELEEALCR